MSLWLIILLVILASWVIGSAVIVCCVMDLRRSISDE